MTVSLVYLLGFFLIFYTLYLNFKFELVRRDYNECNNSNYVPSHIFFLYFISNILHPVYLLFYLFNNIRINKQNLHFVFNPNAQHFE